MIGYLTSSRPNNACGKTIDESCCVISSKWSNEQIDTRIIHLNVYSLPPNKRWNKPNYFSTYSWGCWVFLIDVIHWRGGGETPIWRFVSSHYYNRSLIIVKRGLIIGVAIQSVFWCNCLQMLKLCINNTWQTPNREAKTIRERKYNFSYNDLGDKKAMVSSTTE